MGLFYLFVIIIIYSSSGNSSSSSNRSSSTASSLWLVAIQNAVIRNSLGQGCTKNHVAICSSSEGSIKITLFWVIWQTCINK